jgi:hypothetical protein
MDFFLDFQIWEANERKFQPKMEIQIGIKLKNELHTHNFKVFCSELYIYPPDIRDPDRDQLM